MKYILIILIAFLMTDCRSKKTSKKVFIRESWINESDSIRIDSGIHIRNQGDATDTLPFWMVGDSRWFDTLGKVNNVPLKFKKTKPQNFGRADSINLITEPYTLMPLKDGDILWYDGNNGTWHTGKPIKIPKELYPVIVDSQTAYIKIDTNFTPIKKEQ
jgi:hypothetical protein